MPVSNHGRFEIPGRMRKLPLNLFRMKFVGLQAKGFLGWKKESKNDVQ